METNKLLLLPRLKLLTLLLVLLFLSTTASAIKQPTSYCKCICFQNSTIIPLNSPPQQPPSAPSSSSPAHLSNRSPADNADTETNTENGTSGKKHHTLTCNDCNRAFCLDYNLPICKNAKEEDVFATCFQRDSLKDRTIVILFLLATSSLLGWALIKPFVVKTTDSIRTSSENLGFGRYMPVRHTMTPSEDIGMLHNHNHSHSHGGGGSVFEDASGSVSGGRRSRTGEGSLSRQGGLNS